MKARARQRLPSSGPSLDVVFAFSLSARPRSGGRESMPSQSGQKLHAFCILTSQKLRKYRQKSIYTTKHLHATILY